MIKIIVYSTPTCTYCAMEKKWLKEKNIEFEEVNLSKESNRINEMIDKSGQHGVPVTDVSGDIVIGFDIKKLTELFKQKGLIGDGKIND